MMNSMKTKLLLPIVALLALGIFLGGCATGMTPSSWTGVAVDTERAYISSAQYVYAVNLETHAEAWRFQIKATVFAVPVLTSDGQLIVGGYDHTLYSLDPASGNKNWGFSEARDRWIGSVLATSDMIYAPNADYNLYALNLNGSLKWTFKADQSIWGTPVTDGKNVYFGTLGHRVYAVNAATGDKVWEVKVDGAVLSAPVLKDRVLYFGLFNGALAALDTRNGEVLWQETVNSWVWSSPTLVEDTLYFGDGAGNLYAYKLDGSLFWKQELNGAIIVSPAVTTNGIIVGTDTGNIYFVSLDGQDVQTASVTGEVYGSPVPAGAVVLVSPTKGDALLLALDENRAQSWNFTPAK
jgi:outer membrane protein assembly factor BamB